MELSTIREAFKESEEYREIIEHSEETCQSDIFSAFMDYYRFDNPAPLEFLRSVLGEKGELSDEEIVILLSNVTRQLYYE